MTTASDPVVPARLPVAAAPASLAAQLRRVPPSFFSISMGLFGLAGLWRSAATLYATPAVLADALAVLGSAVFAVLIAAVALKLAASPRAVLAELAHPILGPFYALLPVSGLLLSLQLLAHAPAVAAAVGMTCVAATILLGGWLTGQWMTGGLNPDQFFPGYFLPTVAGGLIAGDVAGRLGHPTVGWLCFGVGMICWMALGSVILNRLFFRPPLPPGLIPTLAIEAAPPAVAGSAYFTLAGPHPDAFACVLAGYCVLMTLAQIRLIGSYRRAPFAASFWAFTFSYEAVVGVGLKWAHAMPFPGDRAVGLAAVVAMTLFVAWIAVRSVVSLSRGTFLPAPVAAPAAVRPV